jgi:nucleoside-diphosphate-sugar epimerase
MTKVAVTGATGFIGRHLINELKLHDVEIIALALPGSSDLQTIENGKWIFLDINKPPIDIFDVIGRPDILIHLAWQGLPNYKSLHHFETELPIQYSFLQKLIYQGLKTLLVTGTCFEYGMQSGPLSEDTDARPNNPYGFAKDSLRRQLEYLQKSQSFDLIWARLFYLFGDGQSESSLLPQLKKAVLLGKSEFNMSGGEQLRDYLPVTEVAHQLVTLALKQKNIGTINICSGKPISVRSLVEGWILENKWKIKLNLGYYPYPDYEPMAFWGINKTKL